MLIKTHSQRTHGSLSLEMEADFKMSELEKVAIPPSKITLELFNIIRMHSDRPDAKETALALVPVFSSYLAIFLALNDVHLPEFSLAP